MDEEKKPVFVKVEEYKDVLDILNVIKTKLNEANAILAKISELSRKEEAEVESWQASINEIERKVQAIDTALFEPESL